MSAIIKSILIVIALIGSCNAANASKPVCGIIEAVPFVIDKGGCYYLTKDLFVSDISTNAITVLADDVTLDLAGQRIVGPDLPNVNGIGVYGLNIKNLHLKNGKISGFLYGVRIDGEDLSTRIYIRKIQALGNYFRGVAVLASSSVIENNVIINTGGTALFPDSFAMGIEVIGGNSVIRGNLIDGVNPVGVGEGIGISLSRKRENSVVEKNVIKGGRGRGNSFGVWLSVGNEVTVVRGNKIYGFNLPFSLPRASGTWINAKRAGSITSRIYDNKSFATACGIFEYPEFYRGLPNSNVVMSLSKKGSVLC